MGIIRWNDQANRWIDGLSTGPQILAWIGIALATYLVVVLACVLTDTPFLATGRSFVQAAGALTGRRSRSAKTRLATKMAFRALGKPQ